MLSTYLPFLRWFPLSGTNLRADLIAGITVALVLIPQSMAYAQLAGLPVVYGLYASFVPVIIASLWGSSNQLHTGPVAMLSLMSAAALIPLATPGSASFIELSIMLALMVGILRLLLGIFRLGAIVNLLSSPVIVGFTNAAALIIGLSQLSKVIGVPFPRSESYLSDLFQVIEQIPQTHWLTLAFALGAWGLISLTKRVSPVVPAVLIAVVITTLLSAMLGYEDKRAVSITQINDGQTVDSINRYQQNQARITELTGLITEKNQQIKKLAEQEGIDKVRDMNLLMAQVALHKHELGQLKQTANEQRIAIHAITFQGLAKPNGAFELYPTDDLPDSPYLDDKTWRLTTITAQQLSFSAGGAVVGEIPQGLPSFNTPTIQWDLLLSLLPAALVMALIGFMEATSISKAIATSTGDRVNTSKELVGQGLANIAGSFFGSYTVSGSFSRSAVAARSGAKTGLFAIISALAVVAVLLFFTSYLYHLPQAVLAVIVMMAVFSLIRIAPLIHAWKVDRIGAIIGVITFFATILMAPAIADGILLGIALTILHYLIKTMKPRVEVLARKEDGTLGGIRAHGLDPISEYYVPVRFDGSLTFVNVAYFEDMILEAHSDFPQAKIILVVGSSINEVDASGEEKIREIAERLQKVGVRLVFSGLKHQVLRVFKRSGLVAYLGDDAFYKDKETALLQLAERYHSPANAPSYTEEDEKYENQKLAG
ncbi:MAG: SulP family inorganic anion transporter [Thioalkalispiraceae bacterium]|jgi:MFS superfamily sulfate permease-like transporter